MRFKLIAVSVLLASCSHMSVPEIPTLLAPYKIDIRQGNLVTPEMREKVQIGMPRAKVHLLLGTPLVSDPFHANRWDYVYRMEREGKLVEQHRLTLYFKDERLVRIDDNGKITEAPVPAEPAVQAEPGTAPEQMSGAPPAKVEAAPLVPPVTETK